MVTCATVHNCSAQLGASLGIVSVALEIPEEGPSWIEMSQTVSHDHLYCVLSHSEKLDVEECCAGGP